MKISQNIKIWLFKSFANNIKDSLKQSKSQTFVIELQG